MEMRFYCGGKIMDMEAFCRWKYRRSRCIFSPIGIGRDMGTFRRGPADFAGSPRKFGYVRDYFVPAHAPLMGPDACVIEFFVVFFQGK